MVESGASNADRMPVNQSTKDSASSSTIDRVVSDLMAYGPEKIILFGSAARGDADEYSDLDFIVVKNTDQRFLPRLVDVAAYLPRDMSIDALVYTPQELRRMVEAGNPFIESALNDGKVLYDKTPGDELRELISSSYGRVEKGYAVKKPLETARRWLAQAEHSLRVTRLLLDDGMKADACFHAEQTAQLVLKAFLYSLGRRNINIHSVQELASRCAEADDAFSAFMEYGTFLDRYYLSTRYPDALPEPAVPFQSFTEKEARAALEYATEMVETVKARVPSE